MLVLICLISLLIALPGFINKAGYSLWKGFIPGYNIYLFFRIIEFPPILLIFIALGLIFLPDRVFAITLLFVLLPFITSDAFSKGKVFGFITLLLPFIMYPYLGYLCGIYYYDTFDNKKNYFSRNKFFTIILIILSFYLYFNFTKLVDTNSLVDKSGYHYVNELYMSDGRVYNNYLNKKEKMMYDLLFQSTKKYKRSIVIDMDKYKCDDYIECGYLIERAHYALMADHPELINYAGFSWKYYDDKFTLHMDFSVNNPIFAYIGETKIKRVVASIKEDTKGMSDLEKIKYVYDWIGDNNSYDSLFTFASKNQSIYNVFMKHNAVCAGFAKASQVIFQNIGINSMTVTGMTSDLHMWNLVEVDGKWFFFDSTIATGRKEGSASYYDGLIQENMNKYVVYNEEWYPKYENFNGLYN